MTHLTGKKVKIIYGVFSGDRVGRRLRREVRHAGFAITKKRENADIIMAHSAGCFWLHDAKPTQTLVLIDPPYWPGRTVRDRAREKSHANFHYRDYNYQHHLWFTKNIWGLYYIVRDLRRTLRIAKHVHEFDLPEVIKGKSVILVRNELDSWCTPDLKHLKKENPKLQIITLPGEHDDWFYNPKPYAKLLRTIL